MIILIFRCFQLLHLYISFSSFWEENVSRHVSEAAKTEYVREYAKSHIKFE